MKNELRQFSPRTFWVVTLIAAAVLCGIVAIPQMLSQRARLEVLRSHVGEVAQLAASVVDGDLHRQLLEPANYTPELYARTVRPLVKFHSADPDIFYVYTMVEREGKTFFVVDTAASDDLVTKRTLRASAYMEPFETIDKEPDADWLQRIAAGQTYVYPKFLRDEYGNFLSGHAPIYDSQGRYSGFVGVDFDLQYHLAREARFQVITIGTICVALAAALLIGYLAARYDQQIHYRLDQQYQISMRDELTQLLNRRGALSSVERALATGASSYAAIVVDLDGLKTINDNHGHVAGDDFLVRVANAIKASVRDADVCARLGGDEFLVFAAGCDLDAATEIARRVLARVGTPESAGAPGAYGVSIGICVASPPDVSFESMYRCADKALYRAKSTGRNRFVIHDPLDAPA
ncbi:MAG TPA: GGDEF domain-containing protein [Povalibacter sp.]|uniref:GGDEF domain-containing protein n=1 Tax=Povalibacter sp. TaxID=1962978 RepID=UPI002BB4A97C|nr:GGDEF domain-containing protein [Povalibacter sp.]HMN46547.1 GGDEF domain-containing protein [Povalibacter sp.]